MKENTAKEEKGEEEEEVRERYGGRGRQRIASL